MGRLIQVKKDGVIVEAYTYDKNGNRASATINNETTNGYYTLDDQIVTYGNNSYQYNDDGYLQTKTTPNGTTTYQYGAFGELQKVVTPTKTIEYLHNANNQRVAKKVDGVIVEKYLWANLTTLLAIYDKDDNLVQRFEYADSRMPIAMTQNNQKYYLHYDQVGSLRAVSDTTGNIIKEVSYDTFGKLLRDSNEAFKVPFGFAGGLQDSDTGLVRFGYRDYDPYTGKWTAKDPIGFSGGDSNLYGYVLGDPVSFIDPTGEFLQLAIPIFLILGDQYLNAPDVYEEPKTGLTPMNELGLCVIGGTGLKYAPRAKHPPHQGMGPHLHWGPRPHPKAPPKYHLGPWNPNHGLPKGKSKWPGWKKWLESGAPTRWK